MDNNKIIEFLDNLKNIPNEINGYELKISKESDGRWTVLYTTDYGYLRDINDKYNACVHSNSSLVKSIEETIDWIKRYL